MKKYLFSLKTKVGLNILLVFILYVLPHHYLEFCMMLVGILAGSNAAFYGITFGLKEKITSFTIFCFSFLLVIVIIMTVGLVYGNSLYSSNKISIGRLQEVKNVFCLGMSGIVYSVMYFIYHSIYLEGYFKKKKQAKIIPFGELRPEYKDWDKVKI